MIKSILTLIFAVGTISFCSGQEIESTRVLGGYLYSQNGQPLSMRMIVKALESNPEAHKIMTKAQENNILAGFLGFAGGALIGWPLGTAIGGGNPKWRLAAIGAVFVIIAIPISSGVKKNQKLAIEMYNSGLKKSTSLLYKTSFQIIANGNGIGLGVNF